MLQIGELIPLAVGFSLLTVLLVSSVTDLAWHRIPNTILLPALVLALILQASGDGLDGLLSAATGLIVGLVFLMPLHAMGGMGAGDVKLLAGVGAWVWASGEHWQMGRNTGRSIRESEHEHIFPATVAV